MAKVIGSVAGEINADQILCSCTKGILNEVSNFEQTKSTNIHLTIQPSYKTIADTGNSGSNSQEGVTPHSTQSVSSLYLPMASSRF